MTTRSKTWIGVALLIVGLQAAVSYGIHRSATIHLPFHVAVSGSYLQVAFGDLCQFAIVAFATVVTAANGFRTKGRSRVFWTLMALGLAFWLADLGIWARYEVFARVSVPHLTIGDTFLFLHLVPMVAALGARPERLSTSGAPQRTWLDFALLLTYWLYVYAMLVMPFQYVIPDLPTYNYNFDLIDKAGHWVLVVGLLFAFIRSHGAWRRIYLLFTLASLSYALFSDIANLAIDQNAYYTGSPYDILLVGTMCFFAYAALEGRWMPEQPGDGSSAAMESVVAKEPIEWAAITGMLATVSMPVIGFYLLLDSREVNPRVRQFRLLVTFAGMALMVLLLFLKQSHLRSNLLRSLTSVSDAFSNLKRVQDQLVQSEKLAAMGRLLAGAAHEINNPLTAILGYSELIRSDETLDERARTMADKIGQQARRTKLLVEDLLKFSQETPTQTSLTDVRILINNAVKLAGLDSMRGAVEVQVNALQNLPPVLVDSGQILQVFVHLIRNAAEAMRNAQVRVLLITIRAGNSNVQIEFADSGEGVKNPDLVFDPFYTTKSPGKGTGLGLSACYGIVQKHGGQITCQNRPQGGAVFTVTLPTAQQQELQNA